MNQPLTITEIQDLSDHQKDLVLHFVLGASWASEEITTTLRNAIESAKQWGES